MKNFKKSWLAGCAIATLAITLAFAATYVERFTVGGSQVYVLENDGTETTLGARKFGSDQTSPTLPTTTTADDFSVKVPFYNASGTTITRGQVIIASATATTANYASVAAVLSTTTWLGIADGTVANGAKGFMSISGYAAVLTTGTVIIGDLVTSTNSVAGYAGAIAGGTSVLEGSVIGRAVTVGTAAGGLTIVKLE